MCSCYFSDMAMNTEPSGEPGSRSLKAVRDVFSCGDRPATSLADVNRLRAQRMTVYSQRDVDLIRETATAIDADVEQHPGKPGKSLAGAIVLAIAVIALAFSVGLVLLGAGVSLMESLNDGA